MQYRVDAWIRGWDDKNLRPTEEEFIPKQELERQVRLRFMYVLTDEDVGDDDDFNDGAIGFTVLALTVPQ